MLWVTAITSVSAGQNLKSFQRKIWKQMKSLQDQANVTRAQNSVHQALQLELQAMRLQAVLQEWRAAADGLGHHRRTWLHELSSVPSGLGAVNLL